MAAAGLTAILGLGAAGAWGAGDFLGGLAARRVHTAHVAWVSALVGVAGFALLAAVTREAVPRAEHLAAAALAGVAGGLGLLALYHGLAVGRMALVAPVTAVTFAAALVLYEAAARGLPSPPQLLGFALASAGIALATAQRNARADLRGMALGLGAGLAFGLFAILLNHSGSGGFFWPLAAAKASSLAVPVGWVALAGIPATGLRAARGTALGAGLLDAAGNALVLGGGLAGRIDVAVVLAGLYPAVTLLLAAAVLRERLRALQAVGVACATLAVPLIAGFGPAQG